MTRAARGLDDLFLRSRHTGGALRVTRRNDFPLEQVLLPERVIVHKLKLRGLGVGVVNGAVDLRRSEVPPRFQFGGVELYNRLPGTQCITFLREDFLHSSAHARPDMHLVYFNRTRHGIVLAMTGSREQQHQEEAGSAEAI